MKRSVRIALPAFALVLAACGGTAEAPACWTTSTPEQLAERPSPLDSVLVTLGDAQAKLCYGRPSARGRQVIGALVPYDAPWRLGANEATALHLPFAAEVGGVAVPAGSYSLYVVPGPESWTVVVNGVAERWGIPLDEGVTARDLGSFAVAPEALESPVETLTFSFTDEGPDRGVLSAEWESIRIRIPLLRSSEG